MLKLSPCIEMLWHDLEFTEKISRVASLGFSVYEFWGWWNKDLDAVERATKDNGLEVAVCCVKTPFADGTIPPMLLPEGKQPFVDAVKDCIPLMSKLNCRRFIVTTGNELAGVSREVQHAACVEALKAAALVVEDAGMMLVLEPLNPMDHPGYYLARSDEAFKILDEVGSPSVKLLFDIYHQHITEGNVTNSICNNLDKIGHFHVANHPGRFEPAMGEINYPYVFGRIDAIGYDHFVGLEFAASNPANTDAILKEVQAIV